MPRQHKPKSRIHLKYEIRRYKRFPYIGTRSEVVLVNTGRDYAPARPTFIPGVAATTNQRDIRGHGRSTSRVKRVRRQAMQVMSDLVRSLPPKASVFESLFEPRIGVEASYRL